MRKQWMLYQPYRRSSHGPFVLYVRNLVRLLLWGAFSLAPPAALATPCFGPSWGGGTSASPTILDVGQSTLFSVVLNGPRALSCGFAFNSSGTVDFDFGDGQTLHLDEPPHEQGQVYFNQVPHMYNIAGSFPATAVLVGMTTWILPTANGGFTGEPVSQTFTDTFTILVGIPEAESYAMMLAGLTVLAAMLRRRNKKGTALHPVAPH